MFTLRMLLLLALLPLLAVLPAQAQQIDVSQPEAPGVHPRMLGHQIAASLDSDVEEIRARALSLAGHYANNGRARVDFQPVVSALQKIYRRDAVEQFRYASVAALHAIGAEADLWRLAEWVGREPSERVQRLTLAALVDRYGVEKVAEHRELVNLARRLSQSRPHVEVGAPVLITRN